MNDQYTQWLESRIEGGAEWWLHDGEFEEMKPATDYRTLYEKERALREAAEAVIRAIPEDADYPIELVEASEHYQSLKSNH